MSKRPADLVNEAPLRTPQIIVIAVCTMLIAMDGFDVLSISFAAPGIAADWGINRAALGVVLAAELVGMAFGSVMIGWIADVIGRRPTILVCLVLMSSGMFLASTAGGVTEMTVYRIYTGLGIGGMLAVVNAFVAEYSNRRIKNLAIIVMTAGFPVGAIVGGIIAGNLFAQFDWHAVFIFGAAATAALLPISWLALPESVAYLDKRRPAGALEKINANLRRMRIEPLDALPEPLVEKSKSGIAPLFSTGLIDRTVLLSLAYFFNIMTFYFIVKWIPKIVVDMGYHPSSAAGVLVWANVGGLCGAFVIGFLSHRYELRRPLILALMLTSLLVAAFGRSHESLAQLSLAAALAGFFVNAAISGFFATLARTFPSELRAGGTGFVIGMGRGGSALGPVLAGVLFTAGLGLQTVSIIMGLGSMLSALLLMLLAFRSARSADVGTAET